MNANSIDYTYVHDSAVKLMDYIRVFLKDSTPTDQIMYEIENDMLKIVHKHLDKNQK